jgi:hypothetical protein
MFSDRLMVAQQFIQTLNHWALNLTNQMMGLELDGWKVREIVGRYGGAWTYQNLMW